MRRWISRVSGAGWARARVMATARRARGRRSTRVSMFAAPILQARRAPSDARMALAIRDRLSRMRFLGFDLGAPTPEENTFRHFRRRLADDPGDRTRQGAEFSIRAAVERPFAHQKTRFDPFTRTIGLARA